MKASAVLRKVARRIERDTEDLGCCGIQDVVRHSEPESERVMNFFELVAPSPAATEGSDPWWGDWGNYEEPKHRDARVIGLCLAAAIAESEGD